jgi:hypothetical protein
VLQYKGIFKIVTIGDFVIDKLPSLITNGIHWKWELGKILKPVNHIIANFQIF